MTVTKAKGAKAKADLLFSKIVRSRGSCQACGSTMNLQTAHIISRRYANTRCDLDNAYAMCAGCHMHFTHWPLEFADFVEQTIGLPAYEALVRKSQSREKVNWAAVVERLKPLWDDVEATR